MDIGVYDDYDNYEEVEFIAKSDKRYIVLVIYDIVDNKKAKPHGQMPGALWSPCAEVGI